MGIEQRPAVLKLTAEQIATLRLVYAHKNSKEIARIMGVSSHTVDERIRRAIRKLGVTSRVEAAIIVAEGLESQAYQPLISQPSVLHAPNKNDQQQRPDKEVAEAHPFWMNPPFPTERRPYNTHKLSERIVWPILIAIGTIMAFAALYAVLLGLGAMLP